MVPSDAEEFQEIATYNRINVNSFLKEIYGSNYEKEPQFENLMKSNNGGVRKTGYLSIEEEAEAFRNLEFPTILESLKCKVNFLLDVVNKTLSEKLKVSSRYWINKLKSFITHPVTATISLFLTLLSILLKLLGVFEK